MASQRRKKRFDEIFPHNVAPPRDPEAMDRAFYVGKLPPAPAARHMLISPRARSQLKAASASLPVHLRPLTPLSSRSQVSVEASAASTWQTCAGSQKAH